MKLDKTFLLEVKTIANGDGSREAKFNFFKPAKAAAKELSTISVATIFNDVVRKYGRVVVAVCVAATILDREERLSLRFVRWARTVLDNWHNRPNDISSVIINDELHPTRIEEYANSFLRLTTEE